MIKQVPEHLKLRDESEVDNYYLFKVVNDILNNYAYKHISIDLDAIVRRKFKGFDHKIYSDVHHIIDNNIRRKII